MWVLAAVSNRGAQGANMSHSLTILLHQQSGTVFSYRPRLAYLSTR
jgi:hypothetical protein